MGSIFVTARDGNKEAKIDVIIEKLEIIKIELKLISLGISLKK